MSEPPNPNYKRVVVKVGTSTLTNNATGTPDRVYINTLAAQIARLRQQNRHVVLVTSGAVGAGVARLGLAERPRAIPQKQAAASVGQTVLMALYADIFANYAVPVGQVLLTRDDLKHRARYINARNTFEALFNVGALPIVNENDTTATDEIRVGDNDTLAALVASLLNADALILLSDVQGLYDKNPAQYADAKLVETVSDIDTVRQFAGGAGSPGGTGGMKTKIVAAEIATCSGVALWIAHGKRPDVLHECLSHAHQAGTYFAPSQTRPSARKRWLAWAGGTPKGILTVNEHARRALVEANGSLLPVGIVHVGGDFVSGDFVAIADEAGTVFARGIARHKADQVRRVAGKTSSEIAQIAGEANKIGAVIHRDALVLVLGA